jgi:hypothetical protein
MDQGSITARLMLDIQCTKGHSLSTLVFPANYHIHLLFRAGTGACFWCCTTALRGIAPHATPTPPNPGVTAQLFSHVHIRTLLHIWQGTWLSSLQEYGGEQCSGKELWATLPEIEHCSNVTHEHILHLALCVDVSVLRVQEVVPRTFCKLQNKRKHHCNHA